MFFVLSKTLDALLSPLTWALGAMIVSGLLSRRGSHRGSRIAAATSVLMLFVFSMGPTRNTLFRALEASAEVTQRPDVEYDVVVVLGGFVTPDPKVVGGASYSDGVDRLTTAFELLRSGKARYAILSGVLEGETMYAQLVAWGIDPERLIIEPEARNTRQNAVYSRAIIDARGFRSVLLVTSAFHQLRSVECFRAVGLEVDTSPSDYRGAEASYAIGNWLPRAVYLGDSETALRELGGRVVYRSVGYAKSR